MFNFKGTTLFYLLLLCVAFFTTACEEDLLQEEVTPPNSSLQVREMLGPAMARAFAPPSDSTMMEADSACFTFNYPLDLLLTDGTTVSAGNDAELAARFADGEMSGVFVADFVYPYTITLADGTEETIEGFEALLGVLITCFGDIEDWDDEDWDDEDWDDHGDCPEDFDFEGECFELVYPLSLSVNGETVSIASEDAFEDFLDNLEGDTITEFDFIFPFSIEFVEDNSTVEITSEEDLLEVIEACDFDEWDDDDDDDDDDYGDDDDFEFDEFEECFTINYPLNLLVNDETVVVSDEDALVALLSDSVEVEEIDLLYPLSVTLVETGETLTINDEDEWDALCDLCHDDEEYFFDEDCFEVAFPVNLIVAGETVSVADEEALEDLLDEIDPEDFGGVAFPVSVVLEDTGVVVAINSEAEWIALLESCD